MNKTALEVVLQRDRVIVAAGLGEVVVLAWSLKAAVDARSVVDFRRRFQWSL